MHLTITTMYQKSTSEQLNFPDFYLPFAGKLNPKNRWVILSKIIPWEDIEKHYQSQLADTGMGAPAMNGRKAFGALIIKEKMSLSDEETVEQIKENPYLQYFIGLYEYKDEAPFDTSMMVHFRKRFKTSNLNDINELIVKTAKKLTPDQEENQQEPESPPAAIDTQCSQTAKNTDTAKKQPNKGKMLIDATCTPADITFPTDLKLLNHTRETLERIIDRLHEPLKGKVKKPRTYRRVARRGFIAYTKHKNPNAIKTHQVIGTQLRYIQRDIGHIDTLLTNGATLTTLNKYDYKCLLVGQTIYQQQLEMYIKEERRVDDRILNVMQPHVRPIIRGKAGKKVEFGAKLSVSCVDGYVYLDRLSWDAFNESGDLEMQVEAYKTRHGHYPASVHADKIYKTRANRAYCKAKEIRLSGPPLGRPKKETESNREELRAAKEQIYDDEIKRIEIEGKFGNCKRKGTLDRIMAKLVETSEAVIGIGLIMLNLDKALRKVLCWVWSWLYLELRGANTTLESPAKSPTNQKGNGVFQIKPLVKLAA